MIGDPVWYDNLDYRLSGDKHWQPRKKWIDSDKTLPLEVYISDLRRWTKVTGCPLFWQYRDYRELVEEIAEPIRQEEVKADLLKPYMREIAMLTAYDEACEIAPFLTTKEGPQVFAMAFKMGWNKHGQK